MLHIYFISTPYCNIPRLFNKQFTIVIFNREACAVNLFGISAKSLLSLKPLSAAFVFDIMGHLASDNFASGIDIVQRGIE
jgi:hypothetical protein